MNAALPLLAERSRQLLGVDPLRKASGIEGAVPLPQVRPSSTVCLLLAAHKPSLCFSACLRFRASTMPYPLSNARFSEDSFSRLHAIVLCVLSNKNSMPLLCRMTWQSFLEASPRCKALRHQVLLRMPATSSPLMWTNKSWKSKTLHSRYNRTSY
jgi:hypothetical protein